jgi:hypothetical protein
MVKIGYAYKHVLLELLFYLPRKIFAASGSMETSSNHIHLVASSSCTEADALSNWTEGNP